jgi:hypothetical protein
VKADPTKIWRERVFWMWLAVFLSSTLGSLASYMAFALMSTHSDSTARAATQMPLYLLPSLIPITIAVSLAKGKWVAFFSKLTQLFENRRSLALAAVFCVILSFYVRNTAMATFYSRNNIHGNSSIWQNLALTIYPLVTALLLVWLMPTQNQKIRKNA